MGHPLGTLSQLVLIDGNQTLMDESSDGVRARLRELAVRCGSGLAAGIMELDHRL